MSAFVSPPVSNTALNFASRTPTTFKPADNRLTTFCPQCGEEIDKVQIINGRFVTFYSDGYWKEEFVSPGLLNTWCPVCPKCCQVIFDNFVEAQNFFMGQEYAKIKVVMRFLLNENLEIIPLNATSNGDE